METRSCHKTSPVSSVIETTNNSDTVYQMDLIIPNQLLKRSLTLSCGQRTQFFGRTDSEETMKIIVEKYKSEKIKMSFQGSKGPVLKLIESTWQCRINSIKTLNSDSDETYSELPRGETLHEVQIQQVKVENDPTFALEDSGHIASKERKKLKTEKYKGGKSQQKMFKASQGKKSKVLRNQRNEAATQETRAKRVLRKPGKSKKNESDSEVPDDWFDDPTDFEESVEESKQDEFVPDDMDLREKSLEAESTTCKICSKDCKKTSSLQAHVPSHSLAYSTYMTLIFEGKIEEFAKRNLKPDLECQICGKMGRSRTSFQNHIRSHQITIKQYKAMVAQGLLEEFIKSGKIPVDLADSRADHEADKAQSECMICNRLFPNANSLQNHIRSHKLSWYKYHDLLESDTLEEFLQTDKDVVVDPQHNREKKKTTASKPGRPDATSQKLNKLVCPLCKNSYKTLGSLRAHLRLKHPGDEFKQDVLEAVESYRRKASVRLSPIIIDCPVCDIQFHGSRILKHLQDLHSDHPNFEDLYAASKQTFRKCRQEEDCKVPAWTTYKTCKLCGKKMRQRFLRVHVKFRCTKNPQRIKGLRCNRCSYITTKPEDLDLHMKKHDPGKTYMCHLCGKSYKNNSGLVIHERTIHQIVKKIPPKEYSCEDCGKKFMYKNRYDTHRLKHSDEANVQCDICGKMFKTEQDVKRHKKTQHMGVYRYHCDKCGHGMEKMSYLKNHKCGRVKRKPGMPPLPHPGENELLLATEVLPVQYEVVNIMPRTWTTHDGSIVTVQSEDQPDLAQPQTTTVGDFKYIDQQVIQQHAGTDVGTLQTLEHLGWPNNENTVDLPVVTQSQQMIISENVSDANTAFVLEPTIYATSAGETLMTVPQPEGQQAGIALATHSQPHQIVSILPMANEAEEQSVTDEVPISQSDS